MDKIKSLIFKYYKILSLDELSILPAYLSYSLVLAIIPILTLLVVIVLPFGVNIESISSLINSIFPASASKIIIDTITGSSFDITIGILNIVTFFVASKGMYAIIRASNNLYKIKSNSIIKDRLRSFLILIILIMLFIFLMVVPLLGDSILNIISGLNIPKEIITSINLVYKLLKWPTTLLLVFITIKLVYIIAPSIKIKGKDTTLGAFITTISWSLFTAIFSYYINYFGKYDIVYGSLSNIIILLIWFYVLSFILLLGIVINTRKYSKESK